jgi:hypothetical protein
MEEEAEPLLNAIRAGDPSLEKVLFAEDIVYRCNFCSTHDLTKIETVAKHSLLGIITHSQIA